MRTSSTWGGPAGRPNLPLAETALAGYRLSGDSQHVIYVGTDGHVHELYIHTGADWVDNDLTALT